MKLNKLTLRNFKGIRDFTLDIQGKDVEVFGDNGTGKTTLADGASWLLFNKNSTNQTDFDIKTLGSDGQPMHGLEHEVEGVLDMGGTTLTLRKVYQENWTKKRGSATKEFTGHSTDYYLDGVPVKKNEYEAKIASIVDEDAFKLLTNPRHFNEVLHWQERRKILLDVCGDVSDEDVIASDEDLARLPEILNGHNLEDHRKVIQAKRTEINRELEGIPVRIDEAQRGLPAAGESPESITSLLAVLKADHSKISQHIANMEAGGEIAEKTKELRTVETEEIKIQKDHWVQTANKTQSAKAELRKLEDEVSDFEAGIKSRQRLASDNLEAISFNEVAMSQLRKEWNEVNASEFTFEQSDTCPTCGQALPAEQVEAARAKALANFNQKKAEILEATTSEGKTTKSRNEKLLVEQGINENSISDTQAKLAEAKGKVANARTLAISLEQKETDYTNTPEYIALGKKEALLEHQITELRAESMDELGHVRLDLREKEAHIAECEAALAEIQQRATGLKRIEELKIQERTLATEFEKLEQELYLTEQFVRTKVQLLEGKINGKFKMARFKLFDEQVNGAIAECCETIYQGIPYGSALNNSARINIGLDIINTLSEHFQFIAPIWMDNAEAVTRLLPTKGQQIKLYVAEADKVLRVERARERELVTA